MKCRKCLNGELFLKEVTNLVRIKDGDGWRESDRCIRVFFVCDSCEYEYSENDVIIDDIRA